MVVIEESTKSINTKLENIDHNEQKFAQKLDKIERNFETLQKTVTSLTKRRFFWEANRCAWMVLAKTAEAEQRYWEVNFKSNCQI